MLDTINYYPQRDGQVAELDEKRTTTSQLLQDHLQGSHVVKAFNNIFFKHLGTLQRPAGAPDRATLLIAGDDDDAKKTATAFIESLGYDVLDSGSLADSWRFERDEPAYAAAYAEDGDFDRPVSATRERLEGLLKQGVR